MDLEIEGRRLKASLIPEDINEAFIVIYLSSIQDFYPKPVLRGINST